VGKWLEAGERMMGCQDVWGMCLHSVPKARPCSSRVDLLPDPEPPRPEAFSAAAEGEEEMAGRESPGRCCAALIRISVGSRQPEARLGPRWVAAPAGFFLGLLPVLLDGTALQKYECTSISKYRIVIDTASYPRNLAC